MAGRGGVDHDQVGAALLLETLHLAEHEDVLHPGDRRRDHVERAGLDQSLRDPLQPVVLEPVAERRVGGEGAAPDLRGELAAPRSRGPGGRRRSASPDLPSTSTISTLMPARAAAVASVAVTVVLPTPPLPATMTTREVEQK